jgi:transposase
VGSEKAPACASQIEVPHGYCPITGRAGLCPGVQGASHRETFVPPQAGCEKTARETISAFNERGLAVLQRRFSPGRPPKFTDDDKWAIIEIATSRPRDLGLPFSRWSLSKLRGYLIAQGAVETIGLSWLRRILQDADLSYQKTRTWKESNDPKFQSKKNGSSRCTRRSRTRDRSTDG